MEFFYVIHCYELCCVETGCSISLSVLEYNDEYYWDSCICLSGNSRNNDVIWYHVDVDVGRLSEIEAVNKL